jgi:hypothetical protein
MTGSILQIQCFSVFRGGLGVKEILIRIVSFSSFPRTNKKKNVLDSVIISYQILDQKKKTFLLKLYWFSLQLSTFFLVYCKNFLYLAKKVEAIFIEKLQKTF